MTSANLEMNIHVNLNYQNANEDVVKMIIGNKCDMEDKRVVASERGQEVLFFFQSFLFIK